MKYMSKVSAGLILVTLLIGLCSFVSKKEKPTLFLIGDSTVKTGRGDGSNGQWGWGSFIGDNFNPQHIDVKIKHWVAPVAGHSIITQSYGNRY